MSNPLPTAQPERGVEPRLLSVYEVSIITRRSVSSCWRDVKAGRLPKPIKIGQLTFWDAREIHQHIDRLFAQRDAA